MEDKDTLKIIEKQEIKSNDSTLDTCPYCGIKFENPVELIGHVFRYHST